jgi:hypothetical protein
VALNLVVIPKSINDLCDGWLSKPKDKISNLLLFGCGAVFWAIWRTRNDWCFVIKFCLIHLMSFFFVASGWIPGLFSKKRRKKRWWSKEAS